MEQHVGISLPRQRNGEIFQRLQTLVKDGLMESMEILLDWLLNQANETELVDFFSRYFTIGETYFMRDGELFDLFKGPLLTESIQLAKREKRKVNLWSTACSQGEEPYTLAILLEQTKGIKLEDINLLASDLNPVALAHAVSGRYTNWSFRDRGSELRDRYFDTCGKNCFKLHEEIKRWVRFERINLAASDLPQQIPHFGHFDVIFCRNVLMYFNRERRLEVIDNLVQGLRPGGWFITSPSEAGEINHPQLRPLPESRYVIFQRQPDRPSIKIQNLYQDPQPAQTAHMNPIDADWYAEILSRLQEPARKSQQPTARKPSQIECSVAERAVSNRDLPSPETTKELRTQIIKLHSQGEYHEALRLGEELCRLQKLNSDNYYLLSAIALEANETQKALSLLRKILYIDPNSIMANIQLGLILSGEQQIRHLRQAEKLLEKLPEDATVPHAEGMNPTELISYTRQQLHHKRK